MREQRPIRKQLKRHRTLGEFSSVPLPTLAPRSESRRAWYPVVRGAFRLVLLTLVFACSPLSRAADADLPTPGRGNGGGQPTAARVLITDAPEAQTSALERDFTNQVILGERLIQTADESSGSNGTMWILLSLMLGIFAWHKCAPAFGGFFSRNYIPEPAAPLARADTAAEEEAFSRFVAAFSVRSLKPNHLVPEGAEASASRRQTPTPKHDSPPVPVPREPDPLEACLSGASRDLAGIRTSFSEIGRAPDEIARLAALGGLLREVRCLKARSEMPSMLPVWQVTSALEGLVDQIARNPAKTTPSALRTIAGAVDLLHALCVRGLKPNLLSDPPVRFLAVDDDSISRHAVCFSLKKAFNQPDVASNGEAALALASGIVYDVIFLDIQMPGMDGFELCSKIRQTPLNRTTPVVFVTCQNGFDSRAKSSLSGGNDFLGKPFLTFEITLKALTLALGARLRVANEGAQPANDGPSAAAIRPSGEPESVLQGDV